jgi:hypothetical protein
LYLWTFLEKGSLQSLSRTVWATGGATGLEIVVWSLLNAVTLAVWSWGVGWGLGSLSRRGGWIPLGTFYATVLLSSLTPNDIGLLPRHPAFGAFGVVAAVTAVHGALLVIASAFSGVASNVAGRGESWSGRLAIAGAVVALTCRTIVF